MPLVELQGVSLEVQGGAKVELLGISLEIHPEFGLFDGENRGCTLSPNVPRSEIQRFTNEVDLEFTVLDGDRAPVLGLADGDFVKLLLKNGVDSGVTVEVTEVEMGIYNANFTGTGPGRYFLQLTCSEAGLLFVHETQILVTIGRSEEYFAGHGALAVNGTAYFVFLVLDQYGQPVTGIMSFGDQLLSRNGLDISPAPAITVSEIGASGRYVASFQPDAVGAWTAIVGDQLRGYWKASFDVTVDGPLTADAVRLEMDTSSVRLNATLPDLILTRVAELGFDDRIIALVTDAAVLAAIAAAILDNSPIEDNVNLRQAVQRIGATTAGKSSGDPDGPVTFKALDGLTDRVRSTIDGDGNRTNVEYDP